MPPVLCDRDALNAARANGGLDNNPARILRAMIARAWTVVAAMEVAEAREEGRMMRFGGWRADR